MHRVENENENQQLDKCDHRMNLLDLYCIYLPKLGSIVRLRVEYDVFFYVVIIYDPLFAVLTVLTLN